MTRMNDYYFKEIEKIPLLTLEEEKTLATKAFSGDKNAQKKLVEANLRFVVKIANQYAGYMDIDDLINEGNIGLMHAARKFDPANGAKFSTYAVWWIKAYIQKAIREASTGIRFPATKYNEMKKTEWKIASLDKVVGNDDGETTLASFIQDERIINAEDLYWEKEASSKLRKMISKLNQKEQTVLIKRFGLDGSSPMSLSEIGSLLGYSKERIRQLEKRALMSLKKDICYSKENAESAA